MRLEAAGSRVLTTSHLENRALRFADMVGTTWRRREEYDLANVDVYSGLGFIWAEAVSWTLRRAKKPYALTLHGGALPEFAQLWGGRVGRLLQGAHAVSTPSPYLREALRHFRTDIQLLPNAIEVSRYEHPSSGRGDPRLVWLRAFHSVYDPGLPIRTLSLLAEHHPELSLSMAGPDKGDGSLQRAQELAERLGLSGRTTFEGPLAKERVPAYLAKGGLFLNSATVDNAPVSVLEALAASLPVVSTSVGGIPHLLTHGRDALLVPPRDPEAMATAVRSLLADPALAEGLAQRGRAKAEEHDWSRVLPRWLTLFSELAR